MEIETQIVTISKSRVKIIFSEDGASIEMSAKGLRGIIEKLADGCTYIIKPHSKIEDES